MISNRTAFHLGKTRSSSCSQGLADCRAGNTRERRARRLVHLPKNQSSEGVLSLTHKQKRREGHKSKRFGIALERKKKSRKFPRTQPQLPQEEDSSGHSLSQPGTSELESPDAC